MASSITWPAGFKAAGISCGLKNSGKSDLGLIYCEKGATAAAMFTTNRIESAAVTISRQHIKNRKIRAITANSGNANTCTGKRGIADALGMCAKTAEKLGIKKEEVIVASTGIIGHMLPIDKIKAGIDQAANQLSETQNAGHNFAKAILTTDTKCKEADAKITLGSKEVRIAGTAKGAGMIGPNMATTLCFLTTDAAISKRLLVKAFNAAISNSLNKVTVDIHQSTNDTAAILASGEAGNRPITAQGRSYDKFSQALRDVCDDLAKQMALDAEGATRMFKVEIKGAKNTAEAAKAARAIADYPLVKCAINGGDANWGRIICAAGSCGVDLNANKLSCKLGKITVFRNGKPVKFDKDKAEKIVSGEYHTITVDLGIAKASDFCYGCDLSKEYVTINADYHT